MQQIPTTNPSPATLLTPPTLAALGLDPDPTLVHAAAAKPTAVGPSLAHLPSADARDPTLIAGRDLALAVRTPDLSLLAAKANAAQHRTLLLDPVHPRDVATLEAGLALTAPIAVRHLLHPRVKESPRVPQVPEAHHLEDAVQLVVEAPTDETAPRSAVDAEEGEEGVMTADRVRMTRGREAEVDRTRGHLVAV